MSIANLIIQSQHTALISKTMADGSIVQSDYKRGKFIDIPSDANLFFNNGYTIADASIQSLDLSGGVADQFGVTMTFSKVYSIWIANLETGTGKIIGLGGDTNHVPFFSATNDVLKAGPKGCIHLSSVVDGYAVTASTGDIVKIANIAGGAAINVAVAIVGKS